MPVRIAVYPAQRTHTQTLSLDGVRYQLRLQWVQRTRGWYLSLLSLDGTSIIEGQRLSGRYSPTVGYTLPAGPPGLFFVRGADRYLRAHLGQRLELLYVSAAELEAQAAAAPASNIDAPTITLS